jgi:hypothetical protein
VRFVVFVPVGPDPEDLRRLRSLTESVRANLGSAAALVLVNDGRDRRDLLAHVAWTSTDVVVLRSPLAGGSSRPNDQMTAATLVFLRWLSSAPYEYALKLDTDALVIGDFRPALQAAFEQPSLGLCGACDRNVAGGGLRDLSLWRRQLLLACLPVQVRTGGGRPRVGLSLWGPAANQRNFLTGALLSARRHGYRLGEHCLGGSYAVSSTVARALALGGVLEDPAITRGSGLGEDVVLALLVRSAGFRLRSLVAPGEPFALRHQGLLATPEELVAAGHAIVHSLKSDGPTRERELVERFARLRAPRSDPDPEGA